MKWKFTKFSKRLDVFGTDSEKDMRAIKRLIATKKIPAEFNSLVYRKARNSKIALMLRGPYLQNLLKSENIPTAPTPPVPRRANLKDIFDQIRQINEENARQAFYSGVLFYCTQTKRFLFFTPRDQKQLVQLLGDNPIGQETPTETICRVTKEDGDFEVPPTSLIPLAQLEIDGTTYNSFLCFTNHEFKPNLSDRVVNCEWHDYTKLSELTLHPCMAVLFEKDKNLQKLTQPANVLDGLDFEKLITDILHSS